MLPEARKTLTKEMFALATRTTCMLEVERSHLHDRRRKKKTIKH